MKNKINNIEIIHGDLTKINLDIIVNAANHNLLGGGGIDGIIHYKAGPELLEECKKLNGCEIGSAKMTDGYKLPCKKIIHACGPMYYANKVEAPNKLKNCYRKCIELAEKYRTCKIAIDTIIQCINPNIEVKFVCYDELDYELYMTYFNEINKGVL